MTARLAVLALGERCFRHEGAQRGIVGVVGEHRQLLVNHGQFGAGVAQPGGHIVEAALYAGSGHRDGQRSPGLASVTPLWSEAEAQTEGERVSMDRVDALRHGMTVAYWAAEAPERMAIISSAGNRTYAELNARANQVVRALRRRGLAAGDSVTLMCSNRPEFAEVSAACSRGGLPAYDGELAPHR